MTQAQLAAPAQAPAQAQAPAPARPLNSSFSRTIPGLQLAWDSTSLGALKTCPRYYQYSIVEGWSPRVESVHLTFGQHYHSALEAYDHWRARGAAHEVATREALRVALLATWNEALGRPWLSDDKYKNRWTLIRSIIWYLDQFAEDSLETVILANGKPAVELSFRFQTDLPIPGTQEGGETFLLCGHLDRLAKFDNKLWVVDRKTSKSPINEEFFSKFSPDNQFTLYTLAAKIVYGAPVEGIICDGAQVAIGFSRFQRGIIYRPTGTLDEWYYDLRYWIASAVEYAKAQHWPQNDKACGMYGGCQFREICGRSPLVREKWLNASYSRRVWDPLKVRGDI